MLNSPIRQSPLPDGKSKIGDLDDIIKRQIDKEMSMLLEDEEAPPGRDVSQDKVGENDAGQVVEPILETLLGMVASALDQRKKATTSTSGATKPRTDSSSKYDQALKEVETIELNAKRMMEEPVPGPNKRPPEGSLEPSAKRAKLGTSHANSTTKEKAGDKSRKIQKFVKHLTRKELEDMVCESLAKALSSRSEVAELRRSLAAREAAEERLRRRAAALRKQNADLAAVVKRYVTDCREAEQRAGRAAPVPVKITRSVGLTVNMIVADKRSPSTSAAGSNTARTSQSPVGRTVVPVRGIAVKSPAKLINGAAAGNVAGRTNGNSVGSPYTKRAPGAPMAVIHAQPATPVTRVVRPIAAAAQPQQQQQQQQQPAVSNGRAPEVVDLSDDEDSSRPPNRTVGNNVVITTAQNGAVRTGLTGLPPNTTYRVVNAVPAARVSSGTAIARAQPKPTHPAPLPEAPPRVISDPPSWLRPPPRPFLKINRIKTGIVLSWNMTGDLSLHANLATFQIFAYQESGASLGGRAVTSALWKKVGDVKALPLPMACTLTQFQSGHKYHFAVRALDQHSRIGPFSEPQTILLV